MKISPVSVEIELNSIKYNEDDCTMLIENSTDRFNVESSLEHWPSAVGWDAVMVKLIILFSLKEVAAGALNQFGSDLYVLFKKKFEKVTENKDDFDESHINIIMGKSNINIYCNTREELFYVTDKLMNILMALIQKKMVNEGDIDISYDDIIGIMSEI